MLPYLYFISEQEQLLVQSPSKRYVVNGPKVFFKPFFHRILERRKGLSLAANEYAHARDSLNGELKLYEGPGFFQLQPYEEVVFEENALPLAQGEYVEVVNMNTGQVKIVEGELSYKLQAFEKFRGKKQKAIAIDEHNAVLVRNQADGSLRLETSRQAFVPSEHESIESVIKKVLVEEHEVIVLKDEKGRFHFRSGQSEESSFFVPPYWEVLRFHWSSGLHKENRNLVIEKFDLRPKFMWYEFDVRTRDNVELILKVTFFWRITDVETLIRTTDDASGDVCSHARSRIIQEVSKVEFSNFLEEFNQLIKSSVLNPEDSFYKSRGIEIHSVEVREIACKDQKTQDVLSEIIQETTTRINRIQKQISENEVTMKRIEGEILAEENERKHLEMKIQRKERECESQGEQQAIWVRSFLDKLGSDLSLTQKLEVFQMLRKQELYSSLSGENTRLFLTKDDVDLKLDIKD